MSCSNPLYRVPFGSVNYRLLTPTDRQKTKHGAVIFNYSNLSFYSDMPGWNEDEVQVLPCGQCTDCRLNYSKQWAIRCSLEASMHKFNYFITLTYDEFSIPRGEFIDFKGDIYNTNLNRRDIVSFIKNLREYERITYNNTGLKVFYCGEFGDLTSRPHYHLCIFGASEIPDLVFDHKVGKFNYFKSATYEKFWFTRINGVKVLRGFVDISECSFETIAYTSRYIMKKQKGLIKKDFLDYYYTLDPETAPELRLQPFVGMSRRPGIAASYFELHKDQIYEEDLVKYQKKYQLFCSKPPRYFDKLFDSYNHSKSVKLRAARAKVGIAGRKSRYKLCSEPLQDRLNREDNILQAKQKKFVHRGL